MILELEKIVFDCLHCFPIYLPWSDGTRCHTLSFLMLSFKPAFSLSCFTFIKRLFSSSSLSAIQVVSSAYLRLLIFHTLGNLTDSGLEPACLASLALAGGFFTTNTTWEALNRKWEGTHNINHQGPHSRSVTENLFVSKSVSWAGLRSGGFSTHCNLCISRFSVPGLDTWLEPLWGGVLEGNLSERCCSAY